MSHDETHSFETQWENQLPKNEFLMNNLAKLWKLNRNVNRHLPDKYTNTCSFWCNVAQNLNQFNSTY